MRVCLALFLALVISINSLHYASGQEQVETENYCNLNFDGTQANESVKFQTSLGPRVPGSAESSALRDSIKSNLTGWAITESTHHWGGMTLTNLFATWNKGMGSEVILAAHYDTRHKAERDSNESLRNKPILGANDGASGVAVLLELARHIPTMDLQHEVTLFFTDAEDQGDDAAGYLLGAKAWAENLSSEEADEIESFVLVDMVGDAFLDLRKTTPGNMTLWNRTEGLVMHLDQTCNLHDSSYFDFDAIDGIYDDHVPALAKGIPAIDIIDTRYGENATFLGGHWHTHNDTADKVSAESLEKVGMILEAGLLKGSWLGIRQSSSLQSSDSDGDGITDRMDKCPFIPGEADDGCPEDTTQSQESNSENENAVGVIILICVVLVIGNLIWVIYADNRGEG